jgi:hypothetical protein
MIQTKNVILCVTRSQKFGKYKIVVTDPIPDGVGGTIYTVKDYIIDSEGNENEIKENTKPVTYSKEKIDYVDAYIEENFAEMLVGLSRTEKERKKIKIGLMLDTQTNLFENGKTICGLNPDDWELTPEE